jgi:phosphatidate cytidylyltransferase
MALSGARAKSGPAPRPAGSRIGPDLWPRVAAAVAMGVVALAAAWAGGFVFTAFWWVASLVVLWEWQRLVGAERLFERVAAGALALVVASSFAMQNLSSMGQAVFGSVIALALGAAAVAWIARPGSKGWAGAGMIYAGALVVSLGLLRASPNYGLVAILWLFAVVWGADIAAFFAGRLIGGPRLWPAVSPGKTWSGAIVGALAGAVLGLALAPWTNRIEALFWVGLGAAIVSELGDLFESAVKRRFEVKDSSSLIPGHGGLMDRLDAFIAASLFAAIVAGANTQGSFIASGLFQW